MNGRITGRAPCDTLADHTWERQRPEQTEGESGSTNAAEASKPDSGEGNGNSWKRDHENIKSLCLATLAIGIGIAPSSVSNDG